MAKASSMVRPTLPSSLRMTMSDVVATDSEMQTRYRFSPTPSKNSIRIDPNEVVYRTSSLALLRAKDSERPGAARLFMTNQDRRTQSPEHLVELNAARHVVGFMYKLWTQGELCDVTLHALNGDVRAHKLVLAAYTDEHARAELTRSQNQQLEIDLREYPQEIVELVLRFLYTTELQLTEENLRGVLGVSLRLGCDIIIEKCLRHLEGFTVESVLHYHSICQQYDLAQLQAQHTGFICNRFIEISLSRHFLWLTFEELLSLLTSDNLRIHDELELFAALMRWVDFNRQERVKCLPVLMSCVHFPRITAETIVTKVETFRHVFEIPACKQMLYDAYCVKHAVCLSVKQHRAARIVQAP